VLKDLILLLTRTKYNICSLLFIDVLSKVTQSQLT